MTTPHKRLQNALDDFKNQFDVTLQTTGHEISEDRNDGIREEEYWVEDIIESQVDGLTFRTGGWFSIDTRGEEDTIYCRLAVKMNGEDLDETKCLTSHYKNGEWTELEYEVM